MPVLEVSVKQAWSIAAQSNRKRPVCPRLFREDIDMLVTLSREGHNTRVPGSPQLDVVVPIFRLYVIEPIRVGDASIPLLQSCNAKKFRGVLQQAVILALLCASLTIFANTGIAQEGTFVTTGSMSTARTIHTATLLNNGQVLIAGGNNSVGNLASAELYNPVTGTFTPTGSMTTARNYQTATLLNNGMVLIAGGQGGSTLASAELYDPATGTFTSTGSMTTARILNTATLLNNGMVLVAGGNGTGTGAAATAELYDPATGTFTSTGSMTTARAFHTATLLNNGMVLVAGGELNNTYFSTAELYDPATGTFTSTGSMATARGAHTATLLNTGMVLVAGGGRQRRRHTRCYC
jgi:hypothetical protein